MRLGAISIGQYTTRERATRREVKRWFVRWRVYDTEGLFAQPKRGGFVLKGHAEAFADRLRDAEAGRKGLVLDGRGYPTEERFEEEEADLSVYDAVGEWVLATNRDLAAARRRHRATVASRIIAATLTDRALREAVLVELDGRPSSKRPSADAPIAQVIVYHLRYQHLPGERRVPDEELTPQERRARDALRSSSRALDAVTDEHLNAIWDLLVAGREYETARSYWGHLKALARWCSETGRCERNLLAGRAGVKREPGFERVDPSRTPDVAEVNLIDAYINEHYARGHDEGLCVQIKANAMLRIGEAVDLRRADLRRDDDRYWVRVQAQARGRNGQYAWDDRGAGRAKPKVKVRRTGVEVPLPVHLTERIDAHLATVDTAPDQRLFRGPRQPHLAVETFRAHFEAAVAVLFPAPHRLANMTPHALRHAGVTWLLRSGCSTKLVATWGRFRRTSVMLDVYQDVLPSDDEAALSLIDGSNVCTR